MQNAATEPPVQVPWGKMADFVRGVLMPLHADGADCPVTSAVTPRSGLGGFAAHIIGRIRGLHPTAIQ